MWSFVLMSWRGFLLYSLGTVLLIVLGVGQNWPNVGVLFVGVLVGMLLHSVALCRANASIWPTIEEITDWEAVEERCSAFD